LGNWHASCFYPDIADFSAAQIKKDPIMSTQANFSGRFFAAASALVLSLVMISGTVSVPATAQAHTAYASVVA
jgi:hypothetical protein